MEDFHLADLQEKDDLEPSLYNDDEDFNGRCEDNIFGDGDCKREESNEEFFSDQLQFSLLPLLFAPLASSYAPQMDHLDLRVD